MSLENTKKSLVSILMAVYNPNYDWLKEQLISLDNQVYDNIELIIYDDCPDNPVDEDFIYKYIKKYPCRIIHGEKNVGSNKAFEKLTGLGKGKYFAYCDQDDIWENNKIEELVKNIEDDNSVLSYSDMAVIDADGIHKYNTLLKAKPRLNYIYGNNLLKNFFFKNCVSGCCMLIKSEVAKSAVPFSDTLIHDQWLCIVASLYGSISFVDKPLIKYRIHGNNQTGSLKNIESKDDYYNYRILILKKRLSDLNEVIRNNKIKNIDTGNLKLISSFCEARVNKKLIRIFKYRKLCEKEAYFEIIIKYMPSFLVKYLLKVLK